MSDPKPLTQQERYKLRSLEFKEKNAKTLCWINVFSVVVTFGLVAGTLTILGTEYNKLYPKSQECNDSGLRNCLWAMVGMHVINITEGICGITRLDKLCCGCICIIGFFVYEVAVLIYMQVIFYRDTHCADETPQQYYWLLVNIIIYYFFMFLTLFFQLRGLCGGPSKEEIEQEEKEKGANQVN